MFTNLNCRFSPPPPPSPRPLNHTDRAEGTNWLEGTIFGNKKYWNVCIRFNTLAYVEWLYRLFVLVSKNIEMFVYGLILSPMTSGWIDCLFSDNHSSHHSTILFYINIFWLKHKSFDFIASISYCYSIIVLLPHPCWPH